MLKHLVSLHPEASSVNEIARQLGLTPTQVFGVIKGIKNHYEPHYSLLNLGLAEPLDNGSRPLMYRATELGRTAIAKIEFSYCRNRIIRYSSNET